ncbi:MAG: hypothetical protein EBE86_019285 [Hormoscilla sp. GUM202]|nr:hypothetical protein [Hormoscilla sp. GUM202]
MPSAQGDCASPPVRSRSVAQPYDPRISPAVVVVPSSCVRRVVRVALPADTAAENGLSVDSLLICVEPMTFDKVRLVQRLGQLETELLNQAKAILGKYLGF